jgi:hypothetical protein
VSRWSVYSLCGVFIALALPLCLQLVGPNQYYGFRTSATLRNPALWFAANAFAGYGLIAAALVSAAWVRFVPTPNSAIDPSAWNMIAFVLPLLLALGITAVYVSRRA